MNRNILARNIHSIDKKIFHIGYILKIDINNISYNFIYIGRTDIKGISSVGYIVKISIDGISVLI